MKINYVANIQFDRDDVCNLLTMESGGFDYWGYADYKDSDYCKAKEEMHSKHIPSCFADEKYCYEEILAYMIMDTKYPVYIFDHGEGKRHQLTKYKLEQGFRLNAEKRPQDAILEDGDAVTGDCILQYAIFGDIIYG